MLDYDLTDRVVRDLAAARDWYDRRHAELGNRFIDAVLTAVRAARTNPLQFQEVRSGVRAVRCRRFPYRIYYDVREDRISLLAVYHTARDPRGWNDPDRR